jgi:hypothetical protein
MKKCLLMAIIVVNVLILGAGNTLALSFDSSALQNLFNTFTKGPNPGQSSVNAANDYLTFDQYWQQTASGSSISALVEIADNNQTNKFGIYDPTDPTKKLEIFNATASANNISGKSIFTIFNDGSVFVNFADTGVKFGSTNFGFYLDSTANQNGGVFYSAPALNPDGLDHLLAYQGKGDIIKINSVGPQGLWSADEFMLAWENQLGVCANGGTNNHTTFNGVPNGCDYKDLVVLVESVNPIVPEPSTLLLLGAGLLSAIGLLSRRIRK